jgi:hypothetical protein
VCGFGKSSNETQASENTPQSTQSIEEDSTEVNTPVKAGDDVTSKSATLNITPQQSSEDSFANQLKLMKDKNESMARKIKELKNDKDLLTNELESLKKENKSRDKKSKSLRKEVESLKTKLRNEKTTATRSQNQKGQEFQELLIVSQSKDEKIISLNEKLDSYSNKNESLYKKLQNTQASAEKYQDERDKLLKQAKTDNFNYYLILIILIIISVVALASTFSAFYLYRWRRLLSEKSGKEILLPEQFNELMSGFKKLIDKNTAGLNTLGNDIRDQRSSSNEKIDTMTEVFMTFQKVIDEQKTEIKRLKEGYDSEIKRKFLLKFIKISQLVNEGTLNKESLERIKLRFEYALDDCEVESFRPEEGTDFHNYESKELELVTIVKPEKKEDEFKIIEIFEEGYHFRISDNKFELISPSKVKIYGEKE